MTLGEKIQNLRRQRNMSQEDLAQGMHLSQQTIAEWEKGELVPDLTNIVALSKALNVSTDYLLKEPDSVHTPTNMQQRNHSPFSVQVGAWSSDDGEFDDFIEYDDGVRGGFRLELENAIYPIAVLIYLFLGFTRGLWHPGWVIFIGAWILEEIVGLIRTGKFRVTVYGIAAVIFVVLGLFFIQWSWALLVFVVAWIIDEVVVRDKPRRRKKKDDWYQ